MAADLAEAAALLDRAGRDGGAALVAPADGPADRPAGTDGPTAAAGVGRRARARRRAAPRSRHGRRGWPPARLAAALLARVWVVDDVDAIDPGFDGIAVTRDGRVWSPRSRELRQVPAGGEDRVLAERNRRDGLIRAVEAAAQAEQAALAAVEGAGGGVEEADANRDAADREARAAGRARDEALEAERHAAHLIAQRRKAPDDAPVATRRAQLGAALAAERKLAERAERERAERGRRIAGERERLAHDTALAPKAGRLVAALEVAQAAVRTRMEVLDAELVADRSAGERLAGELRACAQQEAQVQARLKAHGEEVTRGEVRAQQARDAHGDATEELQRLATKLGLEPEPAEAALEEQERTDLASRASSGCSAAASSSARSTPWRRTSTRRPSPTSRSSRRSARTSRPRCASSRA